MNHSHPELLLRSHRIKAGNIISAFQSNRTLAKPEFMENHRQAVQEAIHHCQHMGFDSLQLRVLGFTMLHFKEADLPLQSYRKAGFKPGEMHQAKLFSIPELAKVFSPEELYRDIAIHSLVHAGISPPKRK
ncbi:MAG: hypothetical protein Q7R47_06785 [Candidatus Diapherotrites archaeon]|nr:hypothetical protein [Candidatus Diapherotrites archaeon]